ncbi:hypothetical protein [Aggregatibacter actinomycetemcomitans]|uniref:hypothetical protein n=1 Tax=Aggregatibacter actinomycetemcomitans TaxID=714 RepID=UPI0015684209|nr:hypothetical protein [Aggregatibacter actinomycetemcomitans]
MLQKFILAAMTTCVFTACVHKPTQDNTAVITAATPRQLSMRLALRSSKARWRFSLW